MNSFFFKGVNFGFYARNGYYASAAARAQIDAIAALDIEWICLIVTVVQETFSSVRQYRDFAFTPSDDELLAIIRYCHDQKRKVMLRPMIECNDGSQRCHIGVFPNDGEIIPGKPLTYWRDWFAGYQELSRHYLRIASQSGCEAYCFDSELNFTVPQTDHWMRIIDAARRQYGGHLTTSMISTEQFTPLLREEPGHWFYSLDSVGSSMYAAASATGGESVETMTDFLAPIVRQCDEFARVYGKDFYFGECGCCATANATRLPYFWKNGGGYDGEEQRRYLEAVIRAFADRPWWRGLFWWKWDEQNHRPSFLDDPAGDKGFTIAGKPAAEAMKRWCEEKTPILLTE